MTLRLLPDLTTDAGLSALRHAAARNRAIADAERAAAARLLDRAARFDAYADADDAQAAKIARWGAPDLNPCRREGAHIRSQRHPRSDCPCGYAETGE